MRGREGERDRETERERERKRARETGREGERTRGKGKHRSSARQNVSLLYERNGRRNPPTKRPASDDVVLTTPSFARTYSPLRARLARHSRAQDACIVRGWPTLPSAPSRRTSGAGNAGIQPRKESLNGQLFLIPFVPRFSARSTRSYFLFATLLSQ